MSLIIENTPNAAAIPRGQDRYVAFSGAPSCLHLVAGFFCQCTDRVVGCQEEIKL
jgi:hypothetical protein